MDIPIICDVCGSPTKEGDYGEAWWICINKQCKKNIANGIVENIKITDFNVKQARKDQIGTNDCLAYKK